LVIVSHLESSRQVVTLRLAESKENLGQVFAFRITGLMSVVDTPLYVTVPDVVIGKDNVQRTPRWVLA
jgi:hypothetical protein